MNLSFLVSFCLVLMTQPANPNAELWQATAPTESAPLQQSDPAVTTDPVQTPTVASPSQTPTVASPTQAPAATPSLATPAQEDPTTVPFSENEVGSSDEQPVNLPPILGEKPAPSEGRLAPNFLQGNDPAMERPLSPMDSLQGDFRQPQRTRFQNDEITRTAHESPAASLPTRTPPKSVPQQWTVTSDDLEQLIKDSIALPTQDARISGRPLRLLDVLSTQHVLIQPQPGMGQPVPRFTRQSMSNGQVMVRGQNPMKGQVLFSDPHEEQKRVVAYWQLAQSLGQYNLTRQLADFWASVPIQPGDETLLRTAKSAANSLVCEARVTLVADQYSLIETADLVAEEGLPLPSDPPHVGTYFTHFKELFASKPAPAIGRRLDATLPLCREVVESRACSTLAAKKSAAFLADEYAAGRCTFAKLSSAVTQWREEHRAFLRAAYVYNYNICDYVVSVSGIPGDPGTLVTMLIRPTYPVNQEVPNQPISELPVADRTPAGNEPTRLGNGYHAPRSMPQSPTLAPPREDPAVQPASGELPVLEQQPQTIPIHPNRENSLFVPVR